MRFKFQEKGYTASDKKKADAIGDFFIDSIYNPITNVAFDVVTYQPLPKDEMLSLEVKSDGSTTPRDAINHAASL